MTSLSTRFPASSAIEQAVYHPGTGTLDIWYRGGDRYRYFGVPRALYDALCEAPSAGEFVNREIKQFDYENRAEAQTVSAGLSSNAALPRASGAAQSLHFPRSTAGSVA